MTEHVIRLADEGKALAFLRALGANLSAVRADDEAAVVVSFGANGPDYDCRDGSVSATVTKGGETATAVAAGHDLATALMLARGKVDRQIETARKAREKRGEDTSNDQ